MNGREREDGGKGSLASNEVEIRKDQGEGGEDCGDGRFGDDGTDKVGAQV